jgi:hypothetical protein
MEGGKEQIQGEKEEGDLRARLPKPTLCKILATT